MKRLLILIIVAETFFCACHKSADTPLLEEHPLEDYIYNHANVVSVLAMPAQAVNDLGYQFSSNRNGQIVKVGCRNPNTEMSDSAAISLWDASTHNLLLRKTIRNTDSANFIYANLLTTHESVTIIAFAQYVISVHFLGKEMAYKYFDW